MVAPLSHPPLLTSIKIPSTSCFPSTPPSTASHFPFPLPSLLICPGLHSLLHALHHRVTVSRPPKSSLGATTSSNFPFDSLIIHPTLFECYCRHSPRSKSKPVGPLIAYLPRSPTLLHSAKGAMLEPRVPRSLDHTINRPPSLAHPALSRIHLVAQ